MAPAREESADSDNFLLTDSTQAPQHEGRTPIGEGEGFVEPDLSGWADIREDEAIQYRPVEIPPAENTPKEPQEPGWFGSFSEWLGDLIGGSLSGGWPVLKWVLLAACIVMALYILYRVIEPLLPSGSSFGRTKSAPDAGEEEWVPERGEAHALLEEADRLAALGRYDEAAHLLLTRSIDQICAEKPDWVEPSSTARELAGLPKLSDRARGAFTIIAQKVEQSLFALQSLQEDDWKVSREAYTNFALEPIASAGPAPSSPEAHA